MFKLVDQMEQQITDYAKQYKKWKSLKTKKGRVNLIQRIVNKGEIKSKLGFGAMIGIMGGATEFDV